MAGVHRVDIDNYQRLNYFDGLFLKHDDFFVEQDFHIAVQRYINYLIFKEGRLYENNTTHPLTPAGVDELAVAAAGGSSITISPGSALIRDPTPTVRAGYEVHLPAAETIDLATPAFGFADGDTIEVSLERDQAERDSGSGVAGTSGILVAGNDRLVEQAVIKLRRTAPAAEPASANPHVVLASVSVGAGLAVTTVTNTTERGGIRLEILSDDVRAALPGAVLPVPTITQLGDGSAATRTRPVGGTLEITGTNFADPITVIFNTGVSTAGVFVNPTRADVVIPAGAGSGPIQVQTSGGTSSPSTDNFILA